MRRTLALTVAGLAALSSFAFHEGETPDPKVCEVSEFAPALTTAGFEGMVAAPNLILGSETTDLYFTVDLGPDAYETTRGRVDASLTWTVVANDYDLGLNGEVSENYQPIDPAEEFVSSTVTHCDVIAVSAIDFLTVAPVEDLSLTVSLSRTN